MTQTKKAFKDWDVSDFKDFTDMGGMKKFESSSSRRPFFGFSKLPKGVERKPGGIVTGVRTGLTKTGKPGGIVTLEDFEGSSGLAMFGEDWGSRSGDFSVGASVYVTGKIQPRYKFKDDGPNDLKVTGVEYLQTIKDKAVDRITIHLTTDLLDDQIVADLGEIINEHHGKTKLFFQLRDSTGKHHVLLQSKNCTVDIRHSLIDYIERTEALDYKIN